MTTAKELMRRAQAALETAYTPGEARFLAKALVETRARARFPWTQTTDDKTVQRTLNEDVPRLLAGEPYQYVLGEAPFLDFWVAVNPDVLIPRPETEELTQKAMTLWRKTGGTVVDIGTGSGCIAIAFARAGAKVYAVEACPRALAVARENALRLCPDNIPVFLETKLEDLNFPLECTLVVSNPPYVPPGFPICPRVRDYEPHLAIFTPPDDPLYFYRLIVGKIRFVNLIVETHEHYAQVTAEGFVRAGLEDVRVEKDFRSNPRFVWARRPPS
ncbi:MAG: peptide chain release factor N(5)-glutamine methyltransferase [Bacteroidia bacterium]|nr:peptide chain release factor N(5)-glutamine methyltransferase [Bacteroidia bacterium]